MRVPGLVLVWLICLLGIGSAEDEKPAPSRPQSPAQAADAVVAAHKDNDEDALQWLAAANTPDPWLVADELCLRGAHDAARAFAAAGKRAATEKLPAYVEAWRGHKSDQSDRDVLAATMGAMRARDAQGMYDKSLAIGDSFDTVTRIRIGHGRGMALGFLRRFEQSAELLQTVAQAAQTLGWLTRAAALLGRAAATAHAGSETEKALAIYEDVWRQQVALGTRSDAARTLGRMGMLCRVLGDYPKALELYQRALDEQVALGDRIAAAATRGNMGVVYQEQGDYPRALEAQQQALAEKTALGDGPGAAATMGNLGSVHGALGNYTQALDAFRKSMKVLRHHGDEAGAAATLGGIALVHQQLGEYGKALAAYNQALEQQTKLEDRVGAAETLGNIGIVHQSLGDYAKALSIFERALEQQRALREMASAARTLGNIGIVYRALGDYPKALVTYRETIKQKTALGDRVGAARTRANLGVLQQDFGNHEKALATFQEALAEHVALSDKAAEAATLGFIGGVLGQLARYDEALEVFASALAKQTALGNKAGAAAILGGIGLVHHDRGNLQEARQHYERSARAAKSLRALPVWITALGHLARLHLDEKQPARALGAAQKALDKMETLVGGLGQEQGATARGRYASLYSIGALAAVLEDDPAEALTFLESGRAGALLDTLDKREALRWKARSLPPDLRKLNLEAEAAEIAARHAYDLAARGQDFKQRQAAARTLEAASEAVRSVAGRIQRELKQQAALFYPRAKTIEDIKAVLRPDQALVVYGLCQETALAVVLRRDAERLVTLGTVAEIEANCEALDVSDPALDPTDTLKTLRKLLVDSLKLDASVTHVLVSPEGPLCYLPFGALFPQTVVMTPSGTTHTLLLSETRDRGAGILALGNPDYEGASKGAQAIYYRGRTLEPLPATKAEVERIGTTRLLGADATEAGLVKALQESPRWRAVHFACHGLVNVERPMLSMLAFSRSGEDDGFLTALQILRMDIPTDLAVLSACETARGKNVKGEGIVGLTRAFMFAGAPRVICSLWKVHDEATQALMLKFYELWNPKEGEGIPAAAALQQAQAFVRSQDKWKHPYYWAAWVLWGLP